MILGKKPAFYIAALAVSAGLAGCGTPESMTEPIVSSFNEASVEIQVGEGDMGFMSEEMRAQAVQKADAKAVEICARGPNRRPLTISLNGDVAMDASDVEFGHP